jgi:hypothetical protein
MHYRVKAHNIHGWGAFSEPLTVISSSMPDQPTAPTITIEDLSAKIAWIEPNYNYGSVTSYIIKIAAEASDVFTEELVNCDGSD